AIALVALAVRVLGRQRRLLHLFQLEHYEPARLMLWLRRRSELFDLRELIAVLALYAAAAANVAAGQHLLAGVLALLSAPIAAAGFRDWRRPAAKPLVFTARAKRLVALAVAPSALVALAAIVLVPFHAGVLGAAVALGSGWLLLALSPYVLLVANGVLAPVQASINRRYVDAARAKLAHVDPLVVGITGSYGKTTTKFCAGAVLERAMHTLVTPESYNSHLGVVRTVNELLQPAHRAFVVEMGMFRRGDIAELCRLVHPKLGVITAIGPMHLERLGSIEAIQAAKAELMEALPADGHLIVNGDDPRCLAVASRSHVPVTTFGIDNESADVRADGIALARGRTRFTLGGLSGAPEGVVVSARLLGSHNVSNLLAAAAVGSVLRIDAGRIAAGLSSVRAPDHRLSPIENRDAGVIVIDDAYNSNPDGAAAALEVLRQHQAQRRLLVTPGMVELGELEAQLNERFGQQAAQVCDHVVLVGPRRTQPIRAGLLAAGMSQERVHVVADIGEATELLGALSRRGDVILFENDLPDTYAEDRQ
ncbi:MAG: UDP-N-acetylmuramoyl-tripeptide--D-alanyl-D-alanine ligase, partial [Solirubrobacteraceae bacterium]